MASDFHSNLPRQFSTHVRFPPKADIADIAVLQPGACAPHWRMRIRSAPQRRARADGWTGRKRVTFIVTLAASGSVTFGAAAAGLSRKSAYALRKRDSAFASLWERALEAGKVSHRGPVKRDTVNPRDTVNMVNLRTPDRSIASAGRDRFFANLQLRLSGASLPERISQGSCQDYKTVRR